MTYAPNTPRVMSPALAQNHLTDVGTGVEGVTRFLSGSPNFSGGS